MRTRHQHAKVNLSILQLVKSCIERLRLEMYFFGTANTLFIQWCQRKLHNLFQ